MGRRESPCSANRNKNSSPFSISSLLLSRKSAGQNIDRAQEPSGCVRVDRRQKVKLESLHLPDVIGIPRISRSRKLSRRGRERGSRKFPFFVSPFIPRSTHEKCERTVWLLPSLQPPLGDLSAFIREKQKVSRSSFQNEGSSESLAVRNTTS